MNRNKLKMIVCGSVLTPLTKYVPALEKCYEELRKELYSAKSEKYNLENEISYLRKNFGNSQEILAELLENEQERSAKLEKALDNACKKLYWYTRYFIDAEGVSSEEELKERFLNDDE